MSELPAIPGGWRILELGARPDYFAVWNAIREQSPVHDAGEGVFLVSRWELVNAALRNPELEAGGGVSESFGGAGGPVETVVRNWLMSLNGEEHRLARGLVSRLFAPKAVADLEPAVRGVARALVGSFVAAVKEGSADFVDLVSTRLPSEVVRRLFAIDPAEWSAEVEPLFKGAAASEADAFAAVQGLAPYFHKKLQSSGNQPLGGVIDQLRMEDKAGRRLTEAEVMANSVLIVTAAIDTTAGLIANTFYALLENPSEMMRVRSEPALIPGAVDESLRYCPSAPSTTRRTRVTFDLGGVRIPAGSDLFLSLAAANRDPRKFDEPDRFLVGRDASALLTFGGGAHFCLGAALARLEVRILFEELLRAGSNFALAGPVRWRTNNPSVRVPQELLISASR
ncbi:MAG TPA: cytochrome P450 [Alphaproteobacteria bacterium]|nr:cytochrome P450 [Alphaproteobacteria bacterium]